MTLAILDSAAAVAAATAERLTTIVEAAIRARGTAAVSLTGGRTARNLYTALADPQRSWRDRIAWRRVHLFWGDERPVPPSHDESNFGMAQTALVSQVPIPADQVYRIRGELPPGDAASAYVQTLEDGFAAAGRAEGRFDLVLLSLGEDTHIASLFPGSEAVGTTGLGVRAVWCPPLSTFRITLTPGVLTNADHILVMATGGAKAEAVRTALTGLRDDRRWPAQLLRDAGDRVEWFIDREAARVLCAPRA